MRPRSALHFADLAAPGYSRERRGAGFAYFDPRHRRISQPAEINRLNRLAIPPAWTHVWICPSPHGHIQATGRDARGRLQYRYHADWRAARDATKFDRMLELGRALPAIRRRVARDYRRRALSREAVLAIVVRLLEATLIRVGNEEYARTNGSYGLTTLRNRHVKVRAGQARFSFRGKSGQDHDIAVRDRALARRLRRLQDLPGQELFQYVDEAGRIHRVTSDDVNRYLHEIAGEQFSAKDFRTWAGTLAAAEALGRLPARDGHLTKRQINAAIASVASQLGNTPAICRKCYIHPAVLASYGPGGRPCPVPAVTERPTSGRGQPWRRAEKTLLSFLRAQRRAHRTRPPLSLPAR